MQIKGRIIFRKFLTDSAYHFIWQQDKDASDEQFLASAIAWFIYNGLNI